MIDVVEICGWIGSICYTIYSVPQAINVCRQGHAKGMSLGMIALILLGALFSLIYVLPDVTSPLFFNFLLTFLLTLVMAKYYFFPRKD